MRSRASHQPVSAAAAAAATADRPTGTRVLAPTPTFFFFSFFFLFINFMSVVCMHTRPIQRVVIVLKSVFMYTCGFSRRLIQSSPSRSCAAEVTLPGNRSLRESLASSAAAEEAFLL